MLLLESNHVSVRVLSAVKLRNGGTSAPLIPIDPGKVHNGTGDITRVSRVNVVHIHAGTLVYRQRYQTLFDLGLHYV